MGYDCFGPGEVFWLQLVDFVAVFDGVFGHVVER